MYRTTTYVIRTDLISIGKGVFFMEKEIITALRGRQLTIDELVAALAGGEPFCESYDSMKQLLDTLEAEGIVTKAAAIQKTCRRCGETPTNLPGSCGRCGKACSYCRGCLMMGRITACTYLYRASPPAAHPAACTWSGSLSDLQQQGADTLVTAYRKKRSRQLLWAVCGAGKTEMLFPLIEAVLADQKPVMIATPRRDVVQELEPRIRAAFPEAKTAGFYGGKEPHERLASFDIAVATTHQLLRFRDAFPVLIIDEVDAFPFSADAALLQAAGQAVEQNGLTVYVTATPSRTLQQEAKRGKLPAVTVGRRYHGADLPVPAFYWAGRWQKRLEKSRLPETLARFLRKHRERQVLLFVPETADLEPVREAVTKLLPGIRCTSVYSGEPLRAERVKAFRNKQIDVLVTTTILERGITIENVQTAVLGIEAPIFTETALIQIAGRAGRSPRYPNGDVAFFHFGKTTAAVRAVATIRRLNRESR